MKSFKFVKVCLLALGVCSFAFAGVKAGDPPPPWVNKYNHSYWNALSTSTQQELIKFRGKLALCRSPHLKGKSPSLYQETFKYLHYFIKNTPDDDKKILYHVIGFYSESPDNEDTIWMDYSQLGKFYNNHYSTIPRTLRILSYVTEKDTLPDFLAGDDYYTQRHWIRKTLKRTTNITYAPKNVQKAPVAMPAQPALPAQPVPNQVDLNQTSAAGSAEVDPFDFFDSTAF